MIPLFVQLAFVALNIIISYFIGKRIIKSINFKRTLNIVIFWIVFMTFSCSYILSSILKDFLPYTLTKLLNIIGCCYLGVFLYIILLFPIAFISTKIFKKKAMQFDFYITALILVAFIFSFGFYFSHSPYFKNYDVTIDKHLDEKNLKIALVSDIHLGYMVDSNQLEKMVDKINSQNVDIVLIAGDIIDFDLTPVIKDDMLSKFKDLKSTYGTYADLGNHDFYSGDSAELTDILRSNNVNVLEDSSVLVNNDFYVIGRNDKATSLSNGTRSPLPDIMGNIDNTKPTIVLDHEPHSIDEASANNIDLQLSGHTHKGQLFPFNFVTKVIFPIDYGYGKFGNTNVIVSSGYGTWGPPIRTNSRAEIVLINLHN